MGNQSSNVFNNEFGDLVEINRMQQKGTDLSYNAAREDEAREVKPTIWNKKKRR